MPLPGLYGAAGRGPSSTPLGQRGPDHTVEPRAAVSATSPHGARGGLSDRTTERWRPPVPASGWPVAARGPAHGFCPCRSGARAPTTARSAGAPVARKDDDYELAG